MKKLTTTIALTIILMTASASMGFLYGNLVTYPSFSMEQRRPRKPFSDDEFSLSNYQREAGEYVRRGKEYIENCDQDILSIQRERDDALDEINSFIREYNSFAKYGY